MTVCQAPVKGTGSQAQKQGHPREGQGSQTSHTQLPHSRAALGTSPALQNVLLEDGLA